MWPSNFDSFQIDGVSVWVRLLLVGWSPVTRWELAPCRVGSVIVGRPRAATLHDASETAEVSEAGLFPVVR